MGYWCAACVTQSFFLLPLILFSFAIFNLFFFYLSYVSPLLFVSEETENAHVQDSTSPFPFCALKFTRSLLTSLTLAVNSMANLFISLAFEWIMVKFHQGSHKVTLCFPFWLSLYILCKILIWDFCPTLYLRLFGHVPFSIWACKSPIEFFLSCFTDLLSPFHWGFAFGTQSISFQHIFVATNCRQIILIYFLLEEWW